MDFFKVDTGIVLCINRDHVNKRFAGLCPEFTRNACRIHGAQMRGRRYLLPIALCGVEVPGKTIYSCGKRAGQAVGTRCEIAQVGKDNGITGIFLKEACGISDRHE